MIATHHSRNRGVIATLFIVFSRVIYDIYFMGQIILKLVEFVLFY